MPANSQNAAMHGKADCSVQNFPSGHIYRAIRIHPLKQIIQTINPVFKNQRLFKHKALVAGLRIDKRLKHNPPLGDEPVAATSQILVAHRGKFCDARVRRILHPDETALPLHAQRVITTTSVTIRPAEMS